jgi:caffeoyl-CoA O-methyltransferase
LTDLDVATPELEAYAEAHTTPPDAVLADLAAETLDTLERPQMLTGTIEGRFLELLVHGLGAKRVLEVGTYSGYGTISMAAGLPEGGRIDTCELSEEHAAVARRYVERAGHADRVTVHLGPALETIRGLDGGFDFVFIDADKPSYVAYYEEVLPRLSAHGLIAADNTLWSGRILDDADDSESTRAIREFNEHVVADERVVSVMLTVRDGITLIRRR